MALLGHILELKSGKSFAELLDSAITTPLAMHNTKIKMTGSSQMPAGYDTKGKIVPYWDYEVMAPSGALHSNMEDMMKFLSMNISLENTELKNVFDYMHNPRIRFTNKKYGTIEAALGWLVSPLGKEDKKYVWQEGITGGFSSFIGFVETTRTGIVILSNSALPVDNLGKEILQNLN
jgi:CubicO group peptidase (beta-lactamase class C family)